MTLLNSVISFNGPFAHGMSECNAAKGIKIYEFNKSYNSNIHTENVKLPKRSDIQLHCVKLTKFPEIGQNYFSYN